MMPQHMQFIQSVLFCVGFLTALLTNNFKQLEWTNPTLTKILNSTSLDKTFITAWKSVTKLVIFQSFVAKCCKMLYNIALQNLQFSVILYYKREMVPTSVRNTKWLHEHCKFLGYIICILQHFTMKLCSITNFVMLFHAVMEFCLDCMVEIKILINMYGNMYGWLHGWDQNFD
jgi:hypothetical protein